MWVQDSKIICLQMGWEKTWQVCICQSRCFNPCLCCWSPVSSSVDRMWMSGGARHLLVFTYIGTCLLDFLGTLEIVVSQIVILGAVEMVQSARCLLYKHKGFGIISRTPVKKNGWCRSASACNSSTRGAHWDSPTSQPCIIGKHLSSESYCRRR